VETQRGFGYTLGITPNLFACGYFKSSSREDNV